MASIQLDQRALRVAAAVAFDANPTRGPGAFRRAPAAQQEAALYQVQIAVQTYLESLQRLRSDTPP